MARPLSKPVRLFTLQLSVSALVTLIVLLLTQDFLWEFPPLKRAELSLVDHRFQQRIGRENIAKRSDVVIVEINQESFKSLPAQWPWPRTYYTRLVRNLKRAGARAIGIDLIFSSSDTRSPQNDEEFKRALTETGNVVLAGELDVQSQHGILHENTPHYGNVFIDGTARFGVVNAREDVDGILRRYMPFYFDESQQRRIPTFSLAVLNVFFNQSPSTTPDLSGSSFKYAGRTIPRYDETSFLINYYGPSGTFRRVKMVDVLDDRNFQTTDELQNPGEEVNTFDDSTYGYLYDGTFKDKIVLVGSTMPEDKDLFSVSIGHGSRGEENKMFGAEVHANVIQNILDGNFIFRQPRWMTALVIFGLSLFTFVLTAGLKAIRIKYSSLVELLGVAIIVAEILIVYWVALDLFNRENFLADMTGPMVAIVFSYIASTVYSYVTERKQKVLIKSMFSRYVNPTLVEELVAHPEKLRLGGERKEVTVFFSDIENFTQIAERAQPEELVAILNEYLSAMTAIVLANHGTLDKYEGDAIVAFWGAPVPQHDHALRACRAAVQMQDELKRMRVSWQSLRKPVLNVRIGINTGEVVVGNMGGATRFDYTVIGDSVNLGARLEGANKQYRTGIMMSEHTYRKVERDVFVRELDMLVVAGKTEPIRVYELMAHRDDSISDETKRLVEFYARGLELYRKRCWQEAIEQFREALAIVPDDYPSQLYIERSQAYQATPPPDDWDGVFVLRTK